MTWGKQNTEAEAHEQLSYAFDYGLNFMDTAGAVEAAAAPDVTATPTVCILVVLPTSQPASLAAQNSTAAVHPHALLAWSFHTLKLHLPACRPAEMYPVPPAKETQVSPQLPARVHVLCWGCCIGGECWPECICGLCGLSASVA